MSTSSSSFHDYLPIDTSLINIESLKPIQINEDNLDESFDNMNSNKNRRNSGVKRPMNAFLLWARGERKRVSSDGYGVSQTSLSKLLGETWRNMPIDEKQPFLDMAETLKRQYHIDHLDYRSKPKQRSTTTTTTIANKAIVKKHHLPTPQHQLSTMISSSHYSSSSSPFSQQQQQQEQESSSIANPTPHTVQPTVLAMCQAIIPTVLSSSSSSSFNNNDDWFLKLIDQPQPVIVAPCPRTQTSPISSRRAVRIQIINKHDDIALPIPTLLPMTPSPLSSSVAIDDSTSTLMDYLTNTSTIFNMPTNQYELTPIIDNTTEYETLQNSSNSHLIDLNQYDNGSGWIDTPLSNFGTNTTDIMPTSPYSMYDFLCL